jgi:prolyl-tRNA editing enzyme YbaK/EbsC (Cys-tRNA(Pro) deacylase)
MIHPEALKPTLSPSAQKVQDLLTDIDPTLRVLEFIESTRTSQEAADRVGCTLGQIGKSLIFQGKTTGKPYLIITSGSNRVDEKLVAQIVGEKIRRADPEFVRQVTGFAIGGIPPVGHEQEFECLMDQDLFQYQEIWGAAGTPNGVFAISPGLMQQISQAKVTQVAQ